jgi:hypothetical protein
MQLKLLAARPEQCQETVCSRFVNWAGVASAFLAAAGVRRYYRGNVAAALSFPALSVRELRKSNLELEVGQESAHGLTLFVRISAKSLPRCWSDLA